MSQPQWDEEMKFELFRLKSDLRLDSFRVLATPLGLGQIQQDPSPAESPLFPAPPVATPIPSAAFQASVLLSPPSIPMKPLPPTQAIAMPLTPVHNFTDQDSDAPQAETENLVQLPIWVKIARFGLVHGLDLLFVGSTLLVGLIVLIWLTDPTHMSLNWDVLAESMPVTVLQKMRVWALVAGLYLVFTLYWVFFRFVSGQTLGESCVHSFSQTEEGLSALSEKASEKT